MKKMKKICALILSAVLALTMFAGCGQKISETKKSGAIDPANASSFKELYGSQLPAYLDHQYYFDGQEIPKAESNYHFLISFSELDSNVKMGYFGTCPLTEQGFLDLDAAFPTEDFATFGDYFIEYAESSIATTYILDLRAKEAGLTLTDEDRAAIDETIESVRNNQAAAKNMSLDEYLQLVYGPGMDEATFRMIVEKDRLYYACAMDYIEKNPVNVPNIRYALFYAMEGEATEAEKEAALMSANDMKASCGSVDDIPALAAAAQAAGIVKESNDIAVPKGKMVPDFEAWAWDESRQVGDIDVIYATYGYFVVGYLGTVNDSESALQSLSEIIDEEIQSGKHEVHTNEKFKKASSADVLVIVFFSLAAACIVAVIVILIIHSLKNGKNDQKNSKSGTGNGNKNGGKSGNRSGSKSKNRK
ncbi:MAG: hypothetical protein IKD91_04245 [Clostridiales bacterium]|nr:hypothetical protein [Clostridiales bacterium]